MQGITLELENIRQNALDLGPTSTSRQDPFLTIFKVDTKKIIPLVEDEDVKQACLLFLRSKKVEEINPRVLIKQLEEDIFPKVFGFSAKISEKTARKWLRYLGFEYKNINKGCYVDGHERNDVVCHRESFLNKMATFDHLMAKYSGEDMNEVTEPNLKENEKKHVLVVHNESCFQAHDGTKMGWLENGKTVLRKKG